MSKLKKAKVYAQGKAPVISTILGTITLLGAGVYSSIQSYKLANIKNTNNDKIKEIEKTCPPDKAKNEISKIKKDEVSTAFKMYAPVAIGVSLGCFGIGWGCNKDRNTINALSTSLTAVTTAYRSAEQRSIEKYGKEESDKVFHPCTEEVDADTGEVTKVYNKSDLGEFDFIFYEGSTGFTKNPELNKEFIFSQLRALNRKLELDGLVLVNDVYECFGHPKTEKGAMFGWVYDKNVYNKIDFGLTDPNKDGLAKFLNGDEAGVLLSLNPDGYILDKIPLTSDRSWRDCV